ncbi:MAG: sigma 54-interacting transcriptional regulator [Nitrospirae bacterium]|nr:sigma 54-interacting transcriptional regulator [Nitrospirota bacterium]
MTTQLEQTRLRLESLIEINELLIGSVEPEELVRIILELAIRLFSAQACSIAVIDKNEHQLAFAFSAGGAKVGKFRIELGQGIAGWVAQSGKGMICNDVSKDPRFFGGIDKKTGFETKSLLCAPLTQRGQLIGAIEVLNTANPNGFTDEDLQLLTVFGGLAGTAIDRAKVYATTNNANIALQELVQDRYRFIIGSTVAMQDALRLAKSVATVNTTLLLLGESGTGKEVIARAIHQWSPRAAHPFIAVNCMALTEELMESELFGHEKGAFTGAIAQKKGKFELADGGTIFLDEIGDLSSKLQTKLLRVLQEKEFQRVGGTKDIRVNVRILAATNRDLRQALQTGTFREDLYYRLNVVSITMPPLRDRKEDIPALVHHFIDRYCQEVKRPRLGIDPSVMDLLKSYPWPGNVRELQNAIERAVVLSAGPVITEADFPAEIRSQAPCFPDTSPKIPGLDEPLPMAEAMDHFQRALIRKALERAGGNQAEAAKILGLQRSNLSRLMKALGLR